MSKVKALGYLGCSITDAKAWENLLVPTFGLERRKDSPKGFHHYRMDECHHRLILKEAKKDKLDFIGWEVETREELQALVAQLKKKKVGVKKASPALCEERKVMCRGVRILHFSDPNPIRARKSRSVSDPILARNLRSVSDPIREKVGSV